MPITFLPWSRAWQPTRLFLPGEFPEHRSLRHYSPRGHREADMTEMTECTHTPYIPDPEVIRRKMQYSLCPQEAYSLVKTCKIHKAAVCSNLFFQQIHFIQG